MSKVIPLRVIPQYQQEVPQPRKSTKEAKKMFWVSCLIGIFYLMSIFYCYKLGSNARYHKEINEVQSQINRIREYNRVLETKIQTLTSYDDLQQVAAHLNMTPPKGIIVLDLNKETLSWHYKEL